MIVYNPTEVNRALSHTWLFVTWGWAQYVLHLIFQYRFYGEQVVRACVEGGAHHLDISGEPAVSKPPNSVSTIFFFFFKFDKIYFSAKCYIFI